MIDQRFLMIVMVLGDFDDNDDDQGYRSFWSFWDCFGNFLENLVSDKVFDDFLIKLGDNRPHQNYFVLMIVLPYVVGEIF